MLEKWARVTLSFMLVTLLYGCVPLLPVDTSPQECDPDLQSLLIDDSTFPVNWSRGELRESDEYRFGSIEHCSSSFYTANGFAFQDVHEFQFEDEAIDGYRHLKDIRFSMNPKYDTPWEVPSVPSLNNLFADDYYLACSNRGEISICRILAHYDTVVMNFSTHMSPDFMTYDDLDRIVKAIDQKMLQSDLDQEE